MKNETKLEKVKKFLDENGIEYRVREKRWFGHSDLFIPKTRVAIMIEREKNENDLFFKLHKKTCYPVYIREGETPKFVLEKVQNTILLSLQHQQEEFMRQQEKAERTKRVAEQKQKNVR